MEDQPDMSGEIYEYIQDVSADYNYDEAHLIKLPEEVYFEKLEERTQYFVVTSGVVETPEYRAEETFVWCANTEGEITEWTELPGSQRFTVDWESVAQDFAREVLTMSRGE